MAIKTRLVRYFGVATSLTLLASVVALLISTVSDASSKQSKTQKPPTPYYLSLGDSLSVGYQPTSPTTGGATNEGYVDDLDKAYKKVIPHLGEQKLGCSGESTVTMVNGGICTYSNGTQLAQAENFIENNDVAFITIDIGANDIDGCAGYVTHSPADPSYATDVPACVANGASDSTYGVSADGIAGIDSNLPTILSGLESAESSSTLSKGAPIYAMNYYDPFLALYLETQYSGPTGFAETSTGLAATLNSHLASDYSSASGPGPVTEVDVAGIFKTSDASVPATYTSKAPNLFSSATDPVNVQAVCAWTWECTADENIHANKTGYSAIAEAFEAVMGYLP